ncbi:MAG: hypothetical protein K2N71_06265 [Oscillospiraceae bacterium]|nr:hypothetical protein [Oscillospiraceae bacterium]
MKSPTKPRAKAVRFNLFFLEMIIVLLFFSIAAAVILNSFAVSNSLAKKSRRTEAMAFCAQSAAEIFSKTGNLSQTVEELFGSGSAEILNADLEDGDYISEATVPLTESCEYSPQSPEIFVIMTETAERTEDGVLKTLSIKFENADKEELYKITSGAYIPDELEAGLND